MLGNAEIAAVLSAISTSEPEKVEAIVAIEKPASPLTNSTLNS